MKLSVHEMAALCGVSPRTLHYYDAIGLLRPAGVSENNYRWYGEAEISRLRQILFYRELDFPLKDIKALLAAPYPDPREALERQRELLLIKRRHLDRLLALLEDNLKGERMMDFTGFDATELEEARQKYAAEAQERWGETSAWQESQARHYTKEEQARLQEEGNKIFRRFAALRTGDPASPKAQAVVADWRAFLTEHYYRCTPEILAGLGEMYVADERFRRNLDRFGEGTARFLHDAIVHYCRR